MIEPTKYSEVEIPVEELDTSFLSHLLSMEFEGERKRLCVSFIPAAPIRDICDDKVYYSSIILDSDEILLSSDGLALNSKKVRVCGRFWAHVSVYVGSVQLFETYEVSVSTIRGDVLYISSELDGIRTYSSVKNMLACLCLDAIRKHMKLMREKLCDTI